ncbi:MAG: alginate export family protein [Thermoanaerobaculia bacterium]|nr:alginate export family protein [Thermoanaerobaculia bacterium]
MTCSPISARIVLMGLVLVSSFSVSFGADEGSEPPAHEIKIDLRYRFENVDHASFGDDAHASTLRTALSYRTPRWRGWSVFLQAENIAGIPDDDGYNNVGRDGHGNGVTDRPVVADPTLTQINQAYVRWSDDRVTATLGRQEINLGDQRFVGAVAWRQNHQSFDAVRIQWSATPRLDVDYAFVTDVHRIFGDRVDASHHFLTVPIQWGSDRLGGKITAYGYLLDFDEAASLSTLTTGVEWRGRAGRWSWELDAAQQEDAADNPREVDAGYLHGNATVGWETGGAKLAVSADWESLEGGPEGRFQTPHATLHKFNGWTDLFLSTPSLGLETTTLKVTCKKGPWSGLVAWLDHQAEFRSLDYGTEINGQLAWKSEWGQVFALKLASYDADRFGVDIDKLMFFTTYSFGN